MAHWSLPRAAASAQIMIRLAGELGLPRAWCVAGAELSRADLSDPAREIEGRQELIVLRNVLRALPASVPFGFLAGLRYHAATHGMWGLAVISSPDARTAIGVALRYFELTFSFNRLDFEVSGDEARLLYDDADNPEELRGALVARDVGALVALQRELTGKVEPARALSFRAPQPAYADPFQPLFGVAPQYGAARNCVAFDTALLDAPQPRPDVHSFVLGEAQCRELLAQRSMHGAIADRIRHRLTRTTDMFPSMPTVASELGMSTRTLRNRLLREATSYRALVDEVREALAVQMLASDEKVDTIAERLRYNDTSSFIAAFKRWKGAPPRRYRDAFMAREPRAPGNAALAESALDRSGE
jgi:AraC-like DNA-binding protein